MKYAKYDTTYKMFGFYDTPQYGGIEVSDANYLALFEAQGTPGKFMQIVPDASGYPIAVDAETLLTPEQKAAALLASNTTTRDALMDSANTATYGMSDAFIAGLLNDDDVATFKAWASYKQSLSKVDLSQQTPF
jgi:hypothetical protein